MGRLLDRSREDVIADAVIDVLVDDGGYTAEEIIPGLISAVIKVAASTGTSREYEQLLDEASNMLADGGS